MIESFRVEDERVIKLAECRKVPRLMIIAGPNGIGKSTLLYTLKKKKGVKGEGRILYIPPHRAWFRQKIRAMYLLSRRLKWSDFLAADSTLGVEGLQLRGLPRRFDSLDESPSAIKHILGQIETRRREVITRVFDQTGFVSKDNIPDIYEPLRKLISFFLPHLRFSHIDLTSRDDVKCIFEHLYKETPEGPLKIDIDDLSSGEREVITLFLNFIERRVSEELSKFEGTSPEPPQDLIMLIDSPELHLHPALQRRLLDYIREIVAKSKVQFIMTTHSPVLVNDARSDELYVLVPPEKMQGYNQLVKVSSEADKLETVRSITGETFSLTLGKPLVFIEGRLPAQALREPSDKRLLELMCPDFSSYTLIPFYERQRIYSLVKELSVSAELTPLGLLLFAILDNDRSTQPLERDVDRVFFWPVCSIENFLLDADAIWEVIQPHREKLGWTRSTDVAQALKETAIKLKNAEIKLRTEKRFGYFKWHPEGGSEAAIEKSFEEGERKYKELFGDREKRRKAFEEARSEVDQIIAKQTMLQYFRGKEILKRFHAEFIANLGMNYQAFAYQVAERIGRKQPPPGMLKVKAHIDAFVPWALPVALQELLKDLESNNEILSLPENLFSSLTEAKSEATKAVDEAKTWVEPRIDRKALKEKCWTTLVTFRQHMGRQPESTLTEQLIKKIDLAIARVAAIISRKP